jgi:hypothetical protein
MVDPLASLKSKYAVKLLSDKVGELCMSDAILAWERAEFQTRTSSISPWNLSELASPFARTVRAPIVNLSLLLPTAATEFET